VTFRGLASGVIVNATPFSEDLSAFLARRAVIARNSLF
jgi:hypothetical protein